MLVSPRSATTNTLHVLVSLAVVAATGCSRFEPQVFELQLPAAQFDPREQILGSSDLPPVREQASADDGMGVTTHRLSNGMTVYVSTNREKPTISGWIAIRAGSRHDPADSTGLAHYLEHMLFKGTDELGTLDQGKEQVHLDRIAELYDELRAAADDDARAAVFNQIDAETQASAAYAIPNEFDRLYREIGVTGLNAFTDNEATVYIANVPKNRFATWIEVEAERFRDAQFRLFYPELEAVYEEKNRSIDSPGRRMYRELLLALLPDHPYGTQPTIGVTEHLKVPAYADMVAYYQRWYVPNNMAVLLAGDIDPATALPVLEEHFGDWQPKAVGSPAHGGLGGVRGRAEREFQAEGEESLMVGWRTAAVADADEPALSVLDWLMDNAQSGLLNLELEMTQKLPDAGSFPVFMNEAGLWAMRATIRQDQTLAEAEKMLLGVLDNLKAGGFEQSDIDAIVLHEEISDKRSLESSNARVSRMADAYIAGRTWDELLERNRRLRVVTKADVLRVAHRYLGDDFVVVKRMRGKPELPKIGKPKITPVQIDTTRQSPFAQAIAGRSVEPIEPQWIVEGQDYVRHELPAGPLTAVENTRNDLFSLSYSFDRGSRSEPLLCFALSLLDNSGAGDLSAEELRKKLYALGSDVSTGCSAERSGINVSGIDRNMDESLALVEQWLRAPRFDDDTVRKLIGTALSRRKDATEDARSLAGALQAYALYADKSPYLMAPTNATLRAANPDHLGGLLRGYLDYAHRTSYYGPRSVDAAAKAVPLGRDHAPLEPPPPSKYRDVDSSRVFFLHKDVVKADIGIAFPHGALDRDDRPLAIAYGEYLGGGMDALVPQEIREARGLAYSAWGDYSMNSRAIDDSALVGYMQTQVDKTTDALGAMLELLGEHRVSGDRLATSKRALDESYRTRRIDPRSVAGSVRTWELLGEVGDPRQRTWKQIGAMSAEGLDGFARRAADGPMIISVIGDRARIDRDALAKVAPVTELQPDQLFSYGGF